MIPFEAVCAWPTLLEASRRARRGRRSRLPVAAHEYRLERDLIDLRRDLIDGSYRPGTHVSFVVHDPKRRLISAAPLRDRIVHHALCIHLEPLLDRAFVRESFANRIGGGTHRAIDHCQRLTRRFRFALSCDVRQFFPSVDHQILRSMLVRRISDPRVQHLIDQIIDAGTGVLRDEYDMVWFPGDDLLAACRPRGLPIGNLTSQIWANRYLDPLDHFIKRELRCRGYVRYVDDFILFADDKRTLWSWKAAVEDRLRRLRLTLHGGAHPRPVTEGLPFLGFVIYPDRRRLKRRKVVRFTRSLRGKLAAHERGEIDRETLHATIRSWIAHASHGDTIALQRSILGRHGLDRDRFVR